MSAEAAALCRTWSVGKYHCTLTIQNAAPGSRASVVVEWGPTLPSRLSTAEVQQYRAGRDVALAEASRLLGIRIVVLEA